jgi:hypothetical protein
MRVSASLMLRVYARFAFIWHACGRQRLNYIRDYTSESLRMYALHIIAWDEIRIFF